VIDANPVLLAAFGLGDLIAIEAAYMIVTENGIVGFTVNVSSENLNNTGGL
jgi:hypothetical protein